MSTTINNYYMNASTFNVESRNTSNYTTDSERNDKLFNVFERGDLQNVNQEHSELVLSHSEAYTVGSILVIVLILGILENIIVILQYIKSKSLRTMDNTLIIALSVFNLIQAIFGVPLIVVASFFGKWTLGQFACEYYAFVTTGSGLSEIILLSVIAVERYFIIVKQNRKVTSTQTRCILAILVCCSHGLIWAAAPLFGWSTYKPDPLGIACSAFLGTPTLQNFTYAFSVLAIGLIGPSTLIIYSYTRITLFVWQKRRQLLAYSSVISCTTKEMKVAVTVMLMTGAFVMSWIPYSALAMFSLFDDFRKLSVLMVAVPTVLAKCSIIWNPIIYIARNSRFRRELNRSVSIMCRCKPNTQGIYFDSANHILETAV